MLNIAKIFSIFKYLYINVGFLFFKHRDTEARSNIFKFFEDTEKNSVSPCLCVLNKNYFLGPLILSAGAGLAERV